MTRRGWGLVAVVGAMLALTGAGGVALRAPRPPGKLQLAALAAPSDSFRYRVSWGKAACTGGCPSGYRVTVTFDRTGLMSAPPTKQLVTDTSLVVAGVRPVMPDTATMTVQVWSERQRLLSSTASTGSTRIWRPIPEPPRPDSIVMLATLPHPSPDSVRVPIQWWTTPDGLPFDSRLGWSITDVQPNQNRFTAKFQDTITFVRPVRDSLRYGVCVVSHRFGVFSSRNRCATRWELAPPPVPPRPDSLVLGPSFAHTQPDSFRVEVQWWTTSDGQPFQSRLQWYTDTWTGGERTVTRFVDTVSYARPATNDSTRIGACVSSVRTGAAPSLAQCRTRWEHGTATPPPPPGPVQIDSALTLIGILIRPTAVTVDTGHTQQFCAYAFMLDQTVGMTTNSSTIPYCQAIFDTLPGARDTYAPAQVASRALWQRTPTGPWLALTVAEVEDVYARTVGRRARRL